MAAAIAMYLAAGCGSKSAANTVSVSVSPSAIALVTTQTQTFTAFVNGATDTSVVWSCTYTTTTTSGTTTTTSTPSPCTDQTGNIPANSTATTVVFTAPTTFPGTLTGLIVTLTATSNADKTKTGTARIGIDSGIRINITPSSASVPTSEPQQFIAGQQNDSIPNDVTWLVTQQASTSTTPLPQAATCSPGCGSIDASGNYTAPATVPATPTLTVVATSKIDTSRFGTASVVIVQGGPVSFNGLSPTLVPLGALFYDIYLEAPNASSKTAVSIKGPNNTNFPVPDNQRKVVFPEPTSTTPNPTSSGEKIRLTPALLSVPGTYSVTMSDPVQPVTGGPFTFQVVPMRPSVTSTAPQSVPEGTLSGGLTVNGGYFAGGAGSPNGSFDSVLLQGNLLAVDPSQSNARHLVASFPGTGSGFPGLYLVSVVDNQLPAGSPKSAAKNLSVFPDYAGANTASFVGGSIPAGAVPSAIGIDSVLSVAAVADAKSNAVQFFSIGPNSLGPTGGAIAVGTLPTGIAIDEVRHRAIVVNFGSKSLSVLQIPSGTTLATINLSGLIPPTASTNSSSPAPSPFSVGVDPDTNLALVAFSSTNVGFIVNLFIPGVDSGTPTSPSSCFVTSIAQSLPCATASVTLPTGKYPQIAMEPHVHLAFVTPGAVGVGAGPLSVIDLAQPNGKVQIGSATRSSNLVTVTTSAAHNLNPGNPGVVLINGLPNGSNGTVFNGSYAVTAVVDALHFQFGETAPDDSTTGNSSSFAYFGNANLTFTVSSSLQGVAINPITRIAAMADPNADGVTGPQIELINALDQSVSSITLNAGCTLGKTPCNAPELGATNVAVQPYSNVLVAFNPVRNEVSLIDPVRRARLFVQPTGSAEKGNTTVTAPDGTVLAISGAVAVDPDPTRNQAFIVNSGSGDVQILKLGKIKPTHIREVLLTSGQIPGAQLRQATFTSTSPLAGVRVLGTGLDAASQVRLDGASIAAACPAAGCNGTEVDITIPASFLAVPRRFALDVINGSGVQSNATNFLVLQSINVSTNCSATSSPKPAGVAIDTTRDLAIVTNSGCNTVSVIDINPTVNSAPNPNFGKVLSTVGVGASPTGVAVSGRLGIAVVSNNGAGTASIIDVRNPAAAKEIVPDVTVGTSPMGVAIDQDNGAAVVANNGSNTVSVINLNPLFAATPATSLTPVTVAVGQQPIAVAIDPERGTNGNGIAVVTTSATVNTQLGLGTAASVDVIDLGTVTPIRSTTQSGFASLTATPTGIVLDPAVSPAVFYITSSQGNSILSYNPDSGGFPLPTRVGVNPTSLAYNFETGAILTVNTLSNTMSIVDTLTSPFATTDTFGLSGSPQFAAAIHPRTNLAVITDQANNRVLLFPMP
jgi:DNA-binding beta-propeller fold protein YncE